MKKFKFKLKAVLREREIREDERKRDFGLAMGKFHKEKEILSRFEQDKEDSFDFLKLEKETESPNIRTLRLYETYLLHLNKKINLQCSVIVKAAENVTAARQKLLEATRRKKILETLKDHQRLKYYMDAEKQELKDIDEYNVLKAASHE